MQKRLECKIIGSVQGVLFRDFIKKNADELGVVGTVKNMNDESVCVVADGEEMQLKELLKIIHKGPSFAEVEKVEEIWSDAPDKFGDFKIVY